MNVDKLRKAAEMILEALGEDDPSTGSQGASGGCGAKSMEETVVNVERRAELRRTKPFVVRHEQVEGLALRRGTMTCADTPGLMVHQREVLGRLEEMMWTDADRDRLVVYPHREDPEVALLNDLLAKYPDDVRRLFARKLFVSDGYADDPRTVCSAKPPNGFTQSRLGFLNQLRIARGLPRIAIRHDEAGRLKRFEVMP